MRAFIASCMVFLMAAAALAAEVMTERDLEKKYGSGSTSAAEPGVRTPAPSGTSGSEPLYYLKLEDFTWSERYNYIIVEGMVRNISSSSLKNVEVVVMFLDASDNLITTETALIEFNPILPEQSSPFKVIARSNPAVKKFRVAFKKLMGGTLPFIKLNE